MQHYSDELKAKILTEFKQKQSVTTLSKQYIISRTTIYRWLKETEIAEKYSSINNKEINRLLRRIERLKEIIQIINEANCLPSAPLKERLYALEKIYGTHSVHVLCEALNVDRGTFYNHIFRNKKQTPCMHNSAKFSVLPFKKSMTRIVRFSEPEKLLLFLKNKDM